MVKTTLATLNQRFIDNMEFSKERFDKIDKKLDTISKLNSKVDKVETIQNECPARNYFVKGRMGYYAFNIIIVIIMLATVAVAVYK